MSTATTATVKRHYIEYVTRQRKPLGLVANGGDWIFGTEERKQEGPYFSSTANRRAIQIMCSHNTVAGSTRIFERHEQ